MFHRETNQLCEVVDFGRGKKVKEILSVVVTGYKKMK